MCLKLYLCVDSYRLMLHYIKVTLEWWEVDKTQSANCMYAKVVQV